MKPMVRKMLILSPSQTQKCNKSCVGKVLETKRQGAWGDNIAITAICNLYDVSISVLCANAAGTSITPISGCSTDELSIGLIMQFHFVGLDKLPVDIVDCGNASIQFGAANESTSAPSVD